MLPLVIPSGGDSKISRGALERIGKSLDIEAAQRVEHYEMARYGVVRTIAEHLDLAEVAQLLQQTLDEEKAKDQKLTQIAEEEVYGDAAGIGAEEDEDGMEEEE